MKTLLDQMERTFDSLDNQMSNEGILNVFNNINIRDTNEDE